MTKFYNTSLYYKDGVHRCLFCDEVLKKETEFWDQRDYEDFYPCHCEDAIKEQNLIETIAKSQSDLKNLRENARRNNEFVRKTEAIQKKIDELQSSKHAMEVKIEYGPDA